MVSEKATLVNPQGLHMRPAGLFASTMGKCDGADEAEALAAAIELIKSGLGE